MPTSSSYAGPPRVPSSNLVMHCNTRRFIPSLITHHKVQRSAQASRDAHDACSQRTNKSCTRVGVDAGPTTDPPHFRHTLLWKLPLQRGSYPKVSRLFLKDLRVQQCLCTAQVLPSEPSMSKVTSPPPPWSKLPPYHPLWAAAFAQEPMASLAHIEVERRLAQPPLSPHPGPPHFRQRHNYHLWEWPCKPPLGSRFRQRAG